MSSVYLFILCREILKGHSPPPIERTFTPYERTKAQAQVKTRKRDPLEIEGEAKRNQVLSSQKQPLLVHGIRSKVKDKD